MGTVAHYLPEWALWSQVGLTALTSIATASAVVIYGLWQLRYSREKLRHDLYGKRYDIYHAAQNFLSLYWRGNITQNDISDASLVFGQAKFILDSEIDHKLDTLHALIFRIFVYDNGQKPRLEGPNSDKMFVEIVAAKMRVTEISADLPNLFHPYLSLQDFSGRANAQNVFFGTLPTITALIKRLGKYKN